MQRHPSSSQGVTRLRSLLTALALVLGLVGVPAAVTVATAVPANAASAQAVVYMPFSGQWAYNAIVHPDANGNYSDSTSSHPSVHAKYYGDWATDIYPPNSTTDPGGEAVKLHVTSPDGTVTFTYNRSNDTCSSAGTGIAGHGIVLNVLVNGVTVGSIDYEHLDNISSGPYTNGMTIGYITQEPLANAPTYCYTVRHVHVELKNNSSTTYSCWADHGYPGTNVTESDALGVLGSPNTGERQKCASIPSGSGGGSSSSEQLQSAGPAVFNPANNTVSVYAEGADGSLQTWYQTSSGSNFTGPSSLGTGLGGAPVALLNPVNDTVAVYAAAANGQLVTWYQTAKGGSFTSANLGGNIVGTPTAVFNPANNTVSVYAEGADGSLQTWYQTSSGSNFTGPSSLGGNIIGV